MKKHLGRLSRTVRISKIRIPKIKVLDSALLWYVLERSIDFWSRLVGSSIDGLEVLGKEDEEDGRHSKTLSHCGASCEAVFACHAES